MNVAFKFNIIVGLPDTTTEIPITSDPTTSTTTTSTTMASTSTMTTTTNTTITTDYNTPMTTQGQLHGKYHLLLMLLNPEQNTFNSFFNSKHITTIIYSKRFLYSSNTEYEIQANKWCIPAYKCLKRTVTEAKTICSDDPKCSTFYDFKNKHHNFCFCKGDAKMEASSSGSYLYIKSNCIIF